MTTETAETAKQELAEFVALLAEYDSDVVATVRHSLAESTIAHIKEPDLTVEDWLEFLKTVGTDAYLFAMHSDYTGHTENYDTRWYLRHDGKAFIYGTEQTGELYRGDDAERQLRTVIENYRVTPCPISKYPLTEADDFSPPSQ